MSFSIAFVKCFLHHLFHKAFLSMTFLVIFLRLPDIEDNFRVSTHPKRDPRCLQHKSDISLLCLSCGSSASICTSITNIVRQLLRVDIQFATFVQCGAQTIFVLNHIEHQF